MKIEEVLALLVAELKDDIIGEIFVEKNVLTLKFMDGVVRKITVE